MTCFWDAIVQSLNKQDFLLLGEKNFKLNKISLINFLKKNNKKPQDVLWQNQTLKKQELDEHVEAVKCYNINGIRRGHLTSTCDSFLLLICQLFRININHRYLRNIIQYKTKHKPRKVLNFRSNRGHFQRG